MAGRRQSVDEAQAPPTTYTTTSHYHEHPETPQSAQSAFSAYSYGSWDAYTPRSWGLPMPMPMTMPLPVPMPMSLQPLSLPLPSPSLSISWLLASPTTPFEMASAVSPAFLVDLKTARQRQDEHDYLFDKLHSRDETIRRRLERLAQVDAELQQYIQQRAEKGEKTAGDYVDKQRKTKTDNKNKHKDKIKDAEKKKTFKVTRGQARELRRQLWWLQHQIQQIEQDEEHLLMRLGEIMADLQARQWLGQIRQQRYQQYGQQAGWLAQAVDDDGFNSNSNSHSHSGSNSFDFGGYFDAVSPSHTLQAIPETAHEVASEAMAQATTETSSPPPQLTVDSSFVVSPVTPGLHATMPASPVSEAAVSAASRRASMTSPMSPLAPVFRPLSASAITPASTLAFAGMHYSREEAGEVFDDDDDGGSGDSGSSVSDTSFLPPDIRTRRVSHSSAASPTSPRQKRMSLPLVRFAWPENEEK